jgi:hypothetical protein
MLSATYVQNSAQSFEGFTNEMATKAEIGSIQYNIFLFQKIYRNYAEFSMK